FGPALVPVSPSAPLASKKASPTSATYGPSGSSSLPNADLRLSSASKYRQQLTSDGSIEYVMTWVEKATPSGRRYCQLVASARRTSGNDCSGWPTPRANKWGEPDSH